MKKIYTAKVMRASRESGKFFSLGIHECRNVKWATVYARFGHRADASRIVEALIRKGGIVHRFMKAAALLILFPAAAWTQIPAIKLHGIVNAASFATPGLPSGSIAQGSIFSIFGSALGPTDGVSATTYPLATTLSGVSISLTQGSTTVAALPVFVREDQINAVMPSNAPLGWASLRVTRNNARSNFSPVFIVHDSPGIFTFTGTGLGPAVMRNFVDPATVQENSLQAPAKPGQTVTLYLTGLGPITAPDNVEPPVGTLATPVEVWIGGVPATIAYSGRSPCCSGFDQIDFQVPANAPTGCWVPVEVRTSHARPSFASMAISSNGATCSDPANRSAAALVNGESLGILTLTRMTIHEDLGVNAQVDITDDFLGFTAERHTASRFAFAPWISLPPPGTCTAFRAIDDFFETGQVPDLPAATRLDGGTQFEIAGVAGQRSVPVLGIGGPVGSLLPLFSQPNTLFLSPGDYTVSGTGGAEVGAFQASLTMPTPLTWTNRDQTTNVIRAQPLTLTWSGGAAGQQVYVLGVNSDLPTNSSALFLCTAPTGANSFTIPPELLSALPATQPNVLSSKSAVYLMSTSETPFSANGLKTARGFAVYVSGKTVRFQ